MAQGIDIRGKEDVLAQFDTFGTPYFAVYQGKDLKFYHLEDDVDSGRELLEANLLVLERNQTTAPFKIVFYESLNTAGKLSADNIKGSNTFRVWSPGVSFNNPDYGNPERMGAYNRGGNTEIVSSQQAEINELKEKVNELTELLQADDEPAQVGGVQGMLGALLENPQVQNVIVGKLLSFVETLFPDKQQTAPAMVAGITDESDVQGAIRTLFAAGMNISDLQKLANLSTTNPAMFNILLQQLRSM